VASSHVSRLCVSACKTVSLVPAARVHSRMAPNQRCFSVIASGSAWNAHVLGLRLCSYRGLQHLRTAHY